MRKRVFKIIGFTLLGLFILLLVVAGVVFVKFTNGVHGAPGDQPSVVRHAEKPPPAVAVAPSPPFTFDLAEFQNPAQRFGPLTRWWWPGNDVEKAELEREIKLFAEVGMAGVEIQPFTMGLNRDAPDAVKARVNSWDEEAFYDNLRFVLRVASEAGLIVDLNSGSGWPTGGSHIAAEDNFKTLLFTETTATGGQTVQWEIEPPDPPLSAYLTRLIGMLLGGGFPGTHYPDLASLEAVVAAKVVDDQRSSAVWNTSDQVFLDPESATDVTGNVEDHQLTWAAPEGVWRLIAFWSLPDGEVPALIARENPGFVVDHFDPVKVTANYDYLFGVRTGLAPYFGKPLRAIFNDSYEFKADRHYAADFIATFRGNRGYDVTPWLPANVKPGYNHMFVHMLLPHPKPDFVYSDEDWRLRYDYDRTLSDMLIRNFLDTSADWMGRRGLQHRTQAYGMPMDVIKASGHAQIPEAEQLYGGGSEAFLKGVSSGALLHNRSITTAESVVYANRAYMTTPQKIKISVDKAFTSGINQVIFHGTAYRYQTGDFGETGWYPWSSPYVSFLGFSSDLRETNPYWKYIKDLNAYIGRAQYALQSGQPVADVLIYYPFLGFDMAKRALNPEELLPAGVFEGVEPPGEPLSLPFAPKPSESEKSVDELWLARVWETINALEAEGITWVWVNDESLQSATAADGRLAVRGNSFQAVLLPHVPFIELPTAAALNELAAQGARVVVIGDAPDKQPSFLDYEANDHKTAAFFEQVLAAQTGMQLTDATELAAWAPSVLRSIRYAEPYRHLRQFQRLMADGSRVTFIRSKADDWTEIRLELDATFRHAYWMNPQSGAIYPVESRPATYALPPYGSILLYASTSRAATEVSLTTPPVQPHNGRILAAVERWNLRVGDVQRTGVRLFDWREDKELRYVSEPGVYSATFELEALEPGVRYLLDLGTVFFTADVRVNGSEVGSVIHAPYAIDVTDHVHPGGNSVEVVATPTQRNVFVGRGNAGDEHYKQFKGKDDTLMPAGMIGPVQVLAIAAK